MTEHEIQELKSKAISQFKNGKSLFGKDGAFAPLLKEIIEQMLEAEMSEHLDAEERSKGNKRNGKKSKTIKSAAGTFTIATPQDRQSSFEPQLIKKRQQVLVESLEDKILSLYSNGMSLKDISTHISELYDTELSTKMLSEITDRVLPLIRAWQGRSLDALYVIIWFDAQFYKVRHEGKVVTRSLYNVLAINKEGRKEVLGMYIADRESATLWLQVFTDLKNRGVEDILIACSDNLSGFTEALESIYPHTETQTCVVHQIRNSLKYIVSKDTKAFLADLKAVYRADTLQIAEDQLLLLEEKWGEKYPLVLNSWNNNWHKLSTYFQYTADIRRLIYTTNPIEGFHRQLNKVTKKKGAFPTDTALLKLAWLARRNIEQKWTQPLHNWNLIVQQLVIKFGGRMKTDLP